MDIKKMETKVIKSKSKMKPIRARVSLGRFQLSVLFTLFMAGGMSWMYVGVTAWNSVQVEEKQITIIEVAQAATEPSEASQEPVVEVPLSVEDQIRKVARESEFESEQLLVDIAWCESTMRPEATNQNSTATGLFQFLKGTWEDGNRRSGNNWPLEDRTDIEKSTKMAIFWISRGYLSKWSESQSCWK